ncbi:MAG: hypothetical protein EXQ69_09015 [Acidimicrobiia bacterium]|nr:hypothetical protein [Acidimicrobiia bacterium]
MKLMYILFNGLRASRSVLAVSALTAIGCCFSVGATFAQVAATPKPVGTITLGWVKSTANLIAYVSPQISAKYGLKIESVNFNTAVDISTAMISGQIDVGLLTPIHLIRAVDTKVDFVQIAGNARGNTGIVAARKLGLKQDDWDGLKQLIKQRKPRVASSRGSINELLAIAEFAKNGINVNRDLDFVNIANFGQHPQALRSGEFDMIVTLEPLVSLVTVDGVGTLFSRPYNTAAGDLNTNYVVGRDWMSKNPEKAQAFVATIVEASRQLVGDKKAEFDAATKLTGMKPEVLGVALAGNRYEVRNGLPQMLEMARIAYEFQYTTRNVAADLPKAVDDRFLRALGIVE